MDHPSGLLQSIMFLTRKELKFQKMKMKIFNFLHKIPANCKLISQKLQLILIKKTYFSF